MATLEQHWKFKMFLESIKGDKWTDSDWVEILEDNLSGDILDEIKDGKWK